MLCLLSEIASEDLLASNSQRNFHSLKAAAAANAALLPLINKMFSLYFLPRLCLLFATKAPSIMKRSLSAMKFSFIESACKWHYFDIKDEWRDDDDFSLVSLDLSKEKYLNGK